MVIEGQDQPEQNVDALFSHLQELMEQLPQMQEIGARLARSDLALQVVQADRERITCEAEYGRVVRMVHDAGEKLAAAQEAGDAAEGLVHEYVYLSNQRSLHEGPAANSRAALEEALAKAGMADVEEARAALLSDEEAQALRARIKDYQDEYARTLAACQEVEVGEGGDL